MYLLCFNCWPSTCHCFCCNKRLSFPKDPECHSYIVNKETDRSVMFVYNGSSNCKCDKPLAAGWSRFNSTAGSKMPTNCTQKNRCNTIASGWLSGINPSPQEGIVTRTVCFSFISGCCWQQTSIRVRNCGLFYVYYLTETPGCYYRYCVTNWTISTYPPLWINDYRRFLLCSE